MEEKVVVAMSGGVDSSVAALLLCRRGYDVVGVTMKLYSLDEADLPAHYQGCCTLDDVEDARRVCQRLGVPHYVLNVQREFQTHVIDYFRAEYSKRTHPPSLHRLQRQDQVQLSFDPGGGPERPIRGHRALRQDSGRTRRVRAAKGS